MTYYTHAGLFHCDEVTGYAICKMARACNDFERLTDISSIPTDGLIADIGREYDPDNLKFDHHQGFIPRPSGIPYASAGLLWKQYGETVVKNTIPWPEDAKLIAERVDETLIQGIDAHDASNDYQIKAKVSDTIVKIMTLPNIISTFNNYDVNKHIAQAHNFRKAADFMERMITDSILKAHQFIEDTKTFNQIAQFTEEICILPKPVMWKEIIHENYPHIQFVISPSMHPGSPFSLTAVPIEPDSRYVKTPIERPDWFKGFIHQGKWIAGGNSIEELISLAQYNLDRKIKNL